MAHSKARSGATSGEAALLSGGCRPAMLLAGSVTGTLMAFTGMASWTAIVTAFTSAVTAWTAFHGTDRKLSRYSNTVERINSVILWWAHLTDVDKASVTNIERLVVTCEDLFERERESWLSTSMSSKLLAQASEDGEGEEGEGDKKHQH